MTEKQLIELAAKAAAIECVVIEFGTLGVFKGCKSDDDFTVIFNPLYDDGDCARLESVVGIDVEWFDDGVTARRTLPPVLNRGYITEKFSEHNGDKNRARRYASTRAAAFCVKR